MTPQELEVMRGEIDALKQSAAHPEIDGNLGVECGDYDSTIEDYNQVVDQLMAEVERLQRFEQALRDPVRFHLRTPVDQWKEDPGCPNCGKPMTREGARFTCASGIDSHWVEPLHTNEHTQIDAPFAREKLDRSGWWPNRDKLSAPQA